MNDAFITWGTGSEDQSAIGKLPHRRTSRH